MTLGEFLKKLNEDESIHYIDDLATLMVVDENGFLHTVKDVVYETHEDADGSHTIWFATEGY